MKRLIIIGAGDFGREIAQTVRRINNCKPEFDLIGFVDDGFAPYPSRVDDFDVIGPTDYLLELREKTYIVCSINSGRTRKKIIEKVLVNSNIELATIIDPSAVVADNAHIGNGVVLQPFTFVAINATLCDNVILNHHAGVGHDDVIGAYATVSPVASVAGKVIIEECCYIGAGARILQGHRICSDVTIGAGAVVVKDIKESGTYIGIPAKKLIKGTL